MPSTKDIIHLLLNPVELRAVFQWKIWHNSVHERNWDKDPESLKKCFYYLDMTSRSFAGVIKELHPELLVPMSIFYLILRGLDTIEDDMTIPLDVKLPILHDFDKVLDRPGWTFDGNHAKEKDRDLLVHFDCVVTEFAKIKPPYQKIIKDITKRMGDGMAFYCDNAEHNENGVNTIEEYQKYCHYVAGLVGEGCTRLFVEAGLANPSLLERAELMESMGQLLQQTNIIRDIKEDFDDKRRFWPKEVWSKYVDEFEDLFKPENREKALNCNSEMILMALDRTDECLFYLAGLREQSVFNFCAIPQTMAIATLNACYRNYNMFERNVKITKGEACRNMLDSTGNLRMVCDAFKRYLHTIRQKSNPHDPNFLQISIVSGKTEQFIEKMFPSQKAGPPSIKPALEPNAGAAKEASEGREELMLMFAAVLTTIVICTGAMLFVAWYAGARFDLIWEEIRTGELKVPLIQKAIQRAPLAHQEL